MSATTNCPYRGPSDFTCCGDPTKCNGPCEILGRSALPVVRSRFYGVAPRDETEQRLPAVVSTPATPRRIGPLERLIAGPQGDPTLKADFYSFLGCIACGTGLALVLVAIVLAGRVLLGGAQ